LGLTDRLVPGAYWVRVPVKEDTCTGHDWLVAHINETGRVWIVGDPTSYPRTRVKEVIGPLNLES